MRPSMGSAAAGHSGAVEFIAIVVVVVVMEVVGVVVEELLVITVGGGDGSGRGFGRNGEMHNITGCKMQTAPLLFGENRSGKISLERERG